MTTTTHTPGPWEYGRMLLPMNSKDRRCGFVVNGPDAIVGPDCDEPLELPVRICDLRVPAGIDGFREGEANARLIAAAPALLAALQHIINYADLIGEHQLSEEGYSKACEAIEKALAR